MRIQAPLPQEYSSVELPELQRRIAARKAQMGTRLCILGHHYQRQEVIDFADFTGDSLKLSQQAAGQKEAKYIVFCGVHFMAESADVLSSSDQVVILPNLRAGCAMADMADEEAVATALDEMQAAAGEKVMPISYVNSSAAIKAITARAGGACCTSSNARNVFEWAFAHGAKKIFAIPDQHLGRNTAVAMGHAATDCVMYDPHLPSGGLTAQQVRAARFILWKGFCHIHQVFTPADIAAARAKYPGIHVIVHPECPREVVQLADSAGSTEQIIKAVGEGAPGSAWAVGTESNLVQRLARKHPDRVVRLLSDTPAICRQMYRIDLPHLLWVLDNLAEGKVVNQVRVPPAVAADARLALQRMIDCKAVIEPTRSS